MDIATYHSVYSPSSGQQVTVYRPRSPAILPLVILWHGHGPNESGALATLARYAAEKGLVVFVPDWDSSEPDGGRSQLLGSIAYVRTAAARFGAQRNHFVLAGWSLGALAAAGIVMDPTITNGWRPQAFVGIAGPYDRAAPTTGSTPLDSLNKHEAPPIPLWLVHGTHDAQVDIVQSRRFVSALRTHGWTVTMREMWAHDHASVIGTTFDPVLGRCIASSSPNTLRAAEFVAQTFYDAANHTLAPSNVGIAL